jgi:hypothetical protein
MEHEFYKEKISAYFDGELKNEEAVMVAEHLKECQICQQEYDKLQQFDMLAQEHSKLSDSEYWEKSAQRIESAIEEEIVESKITEIKPFVWKGLGWKLTTVAASIALITFIAIYEKDMSDEMYELTEPDSVIIHQTTTVSSDDEYELKSDESIKEIPSEGLGETETTPQKTEEVRISEIVKAPPAPVADEPSEEAKEEAIVLEKLRGDRADEVIIVTSESPLVVRDKTTTIDIVKSEEIQTMPEKNKENEIQPSNAEDKKIKAEEFGVDASGDEFLTLSQWKEKRDILQSSLNKIKMPDLKQSLAEKKTSSRTSIVSNDSDNVFNLLKCYYNIALLTEDTIEYNQSLKNIKKYSSSENEELKKQAKYYIEELSKAGDKQ